MKGAIIFKACHSRLPCSVTSEDVRRGLPACWCEPRAVGRDCSELAGESSASQGLSYLF